MTFKSVFFLSRPQAEKFTQRDQPRPYAVISITDPDSPDANIKSAPLGILRLKFEDNYEEVENCKVGQIPDALPDSIPLIILNEIWPDANHCKMMTDFISSMAKIDVDMDFVVHCEGGISRSAAVAQFIADKYCAELETVARDASGANKRILRILNKIDQGKPLDIRSEFEIPTLKTYPLPNVFWP